MSVTLKQGESVSLTTGKVEKAPANHDQSIRAYYGKELQANNLSVMPGAIHLYREH